MDQYRNALLSPPFLKDPPIKVNINAKVLGIVIAVVYGLGLLLSLASIQVVFGVSNAFCNNPYFNTYANCGIHPLALLGFLAAAAGNVLSLIGGIQMWQLKIKGKEWVIYGLILGLLGSLIESVGYYGGFGITGFIFAVVIAAAIYYTVVISRFPGEPPLVAAGPAPGSGYAPPFGGAPTPPPPPAPPAGGYAPPPPPPPPAPSPPAPDQPR